MLSERTITFCIGQLLTAPWGQFDKWIQGNHSQITVHVPANTMVRITPVPYVNDAIFPWLMKCDPNDVQSLLLGCTIPHPIGAAHEQLRRLTGLLELELIGPDLTEGNLACITKLTHLERLIIKDAFSGGVTQTRLTGAQILRLLCQPEMAGLKLLAIQDNTLDLSYGWEKKVRITDGGFENIDKLANLETLILQGQKVTAQGLSRLTALPKLRTLSLNGCRLLDEDLEPLVKCSGLERLNLERCGISDEGLKHVCQITSLRELNLIGNPVTATGIESLMKTLPLESIAFRANGSNSFSLLKILRRCPTLTTVGVTDYHDRRYISTREQIKSGDRSAR